jgi:ABC-type Fe3+ transport system permease subunit
MADNDDKTKILQIGLILFIVGVVVLTTMYTYRENRNIITDEKSNERLDNLAQILTFHFGKMWPYMLLIIVALIVVIFTLVYHKISSSSPTDPASTTTIRIYIGIMVILAISLIANVVSRYSAQKRQAEGGDIPNYDYNSSNNKQIIEAAGLGVVIIALLGFGIHILRKRSHHG